jgi:LysM repeat protein
MALDVKALAKDKRLQLAAGGGAVLGLVALIRKRSSGDTTGTDSGQTAGAKTYTGSGSVAGGYDSTATDVYNNLQTSLDNQLGEFRGQLTSIQSQLDKATPTPKVGQTPIPKPPAKRKLKIVHKTPIPKPPTKPRTTIKIPHGSTLSGLASKYGTSVPRLMQLNPSIKNANRISAGASLRVR